MLLTAIAGRAYSTDGSYQPISFRSPAALPAIAEYKPRNGSRINCPGGIDSTTESLAGAINFARTGLTSWRWSMPKRSHLAVILAIALILLFQPTSAAAQGKPGGNTGGGTTPTTGKPTRNPDQIPDNRTMREDRPIFLSGKVVLEDGSPLPQTAVIERLCTGTVRREAYTSASGDFAFQVGQSAGVLQDA